METPSRLQATPQGLLFLNDLLALFDEAHSTNGVDPRTRAEQ
jgi:hypothetical protein